MTFWTRVVRIIRIKTKKRKKPQDPLRVLQHDLDRLDEQVLKVKHNSLALGKSRIQLEHRIRDLNKHIDRYQEEARKALRLEREDLARLALRNKQNAVNTQKQLQTRVGTLQRQIDGFERVKDELANRIMIYKIKRDEILLTRSAAEAELSAEEVRLGLNLEGNLGDSQEAFRRLEEEIHQIQAQAEATREISNAQLPPLDDPLDALPDRTSTEIHEELERLKRELGKDF